MKTLFDYQKDAGNAVVKAIMRHLPAALIVMATGIGKTVVASWIVRWWLRRKKTQILFLVHLWEAVDQAELEFHDMLGPNAQFQFLVGDDKLDPNAVVIFSTFQTMRNRYRSMARDTFGLIVVDECHRSKADTYEPIIEYFTSEFKLAMTATEERMDGRDIRELFGDPVYEYPLALALAKHNLADVEYRVLVDNISQATLRKIEKLIGRSDGRVTRSMIDRKVFLAERLAVIARTIKREQKARRKTIIFCNSRRHATEVSHHFPEAKTYFSGLPATILKGRLAAFRSGAIPTLIVVNKLNEAVDIPDADLIVFLRMTESKTVWLQQLGRGLRKKLGKKDVLVLDFAANCDRIRIVGQLAGEIRKYLGISGESSVIHTSGLTFNFETEARNIFELLERLENMPQAGKDQTFMHDGETWGTSSGLAGILKVSIPWVNRLINSHQIVFMNGRDSTGVVRKFYPLSKVSEAFGGEQELPRINTGEIIRLDGELWGMAHVLAAHLGISAPSVEDRVGSCRTRKARSRRGTAVLYALSDVKNACADLLEKMPQAGRSGTFKLQGDIWGTATSLGKMIGLTPAVVQKRTPARFAMKGKDVRGRVWPFYPLSEVKKACASVTKKMPQAGKDGTFVKDGKRWATLNVLTRIFGIGWRTVKQRVASCTRMRGKDFGGVPGDFYPIPEAKKACANLIKKLPQAGTDGTIKQHGEIWASSYAAARILCTFPAWVGRCKDCRTIEGKNASGTVCLFYSLSDARKALKKKSKRSRK